MKESISISTSEQFILYCIETSDKPLTNHDLVRIAGRPYSTVARATARLCRKKLVNRLPAAQGGNGSRFSTSQKRILKTIAPITRTRAIHNDKLKELLSKQLEGPWRPPIYDKGIPVLQETLKKLIYCAVRHAEGELLNQSELDQALKIMEQLAQGFTDFARLIQSLTARRDLWSVESFAVAFLEDLNIEDLTDVIDSPVGSK